MKKILLLVLVLASCKENTSYIHRSVSINEKQKIDEQEKLPEIHFYGELLAVDLVVPDSLAKQYGFRLKRIGGCIINQQMISDAKKNNDKTIQILNKKYGKNWIENFQKETKKSLKYYLILE